MLSARSALRRARPSSPCGLRAGSAEAPGSAGCCPGRHGAGGAVRRLTRAPPRDRGGLPLRIPPGRPGGAARRPGRRDAARTRQAPVRGHRPRQGAAWGQDGHAGRHPGRCPSAGTARRLRPPTAQRGPAGVRAHGLCSHCLRPGEPCRSASTGGGFRARLPRLLPAQDGVIPQRGLWGTNDGAHSHAVEGPGHPPPANRNGRTIWLGAPTVAVHRGAQREPPYAPGCRHALPTLVAEAVCRERRGPACRRLPPTGCAETARRKATRICLSGVRGRGPRMSGAAAQGLGRGAGRRAGTNLIFAKGLPVALAPRGQSLATTAPARTRGPSRTAAPA